MSEVVSAILNRNIKNLEIGETRSSFIQRSNYSSESLVKIYHNGEWKARKSSM